MTQLIKYDGKFYDEEDIEELLRLRNEQLRFYHADGTFEVLASPEEVTKRRVKCAKSIKEMSDQIQAARDIILQLPDTQISTDVLRALGYGGA